MPNNIKMELFISSVKAMQAEVYANAKAHGWHDKINNNGECLVLIHSEISEAVEALRNGNPPDKHIPEFSGAEAELADTIIRILDYAELRGFRIAEAIAAKHEYNKKRPFRHGDKLF